MAAREVTQFSADEFDAFIASGHEPKTPREKYMALLRECLNKPPTPELDTIGGFGNLQRVRVVEVEAGFGQFIFVPKLPPYLYAQKRAQEQKAKKPERKARRELTPEEVFKRAQEQDRRNRIKAAKAAAKEFHEKKAATKEVAG